MSMTKTAEYNFEVPASSLRPGDKIKIPFSQHSPFHDAMVENVDEKFVHIFRPYATSFDVLYSDGIICLVGIEEFKVPRDATIYYVYERPVLK